MASTPLAQAVVGRDEELRLLTDAVQAARQGQGGTVLLLGAAGLGKTRLARETAGAARQAGLAVVTGRCVPGAAAPLRPYAEALLAAVRGGLVPDDPALRPYRAVLSGWVPGWSSGPAASAPDLLVVAEALLQVLRRLGQSALLVLEDLHWADPDTLAVLDQLVEAVRDQPVLVVGTLRDDEATGGRSLAEALGGRRAAALLRLPRLTDDEVVQLARCCFEGDALPPEVERFLVQRADGVPFLAEELLGGLLTAGALERTDAGWQTRGPLTPVVPQTFADTVARRTERLDRAGRDLVRLAAVVGRRVPRPVLQAATGQDLATVTAGLRAAASSGLLDVEHDDVVRFRHALTRDAVLAELLPAERTARAAAAARAVRQVQGGLPGEWQRLAAQLHEAAGEPEEAAPLLLGAAEAALAAGDVGACTRAAERGLLLATDPALRVDLCLARAEALALAGEVAAARRALADLGAALRRARAVDPGAPALLRTAAHAAVLAARTEVAADAWDTARAALEKAPPARDLPDRARRAVLLARIELGAGDRAAALAAAREGLVLAEEGDLPTLACEALLGVGRALRESDLTAAEEPFERAAALAERHRLPLWRTRALQELATLDLLSAGRTDRADAARSAAEEAGALALLAYVEHNRSALLAEHGREDEAVAASERAVALARRLRLPLLGSAWAQLASAHAARGDRSAVERTLARAALEVGDDPDLAIQGGGARAALALREVEDAAALAALDEAAAVARRHPALPFALRGLHALLATVLDDPAAGAVREEVRSSGVLGIPLVASHLRLADAVAAGRAGDAATAGRLAEHALPLVQSPSWESLASRLLASAALADGWGEPVRWLRRALEWSELREVPRCADECRALLRRAGVRVARRSAGEPVPEALRGNGITTREAEVLALVCEGLTNAEIAGRLFLSPRTVEKHVASLLARTGSRSRAQLAVLARSGA